MVTSRKVLRGWKQSRQVESSVAGDAKPAEENKDNNSNHSSHRRKISKISPYVGFIIE